MKTQNTLARTQGQMEGQLTGLSPIEERRKSSLIQTYERKMNTMMQNSNLTFEKIQTPGWSSLVDSNISQNKKTVTKEDILNKLISLNSKTFEQVDCERPLKVITGQLRSTSNLPKAFKVTKSDIKPKVQSGTRPHTASMPDKPNQSQLQHHPPQQTEKRWREINVYEHLYLDSKKQQTKRMVEKIMDEEIRNDVFKFHPTINQNSIMLAEQRQKKLQVDPYYRCAFKSQAREPQKKTIVDPSDQEFKCLHALFYIISSGTMTLEKDSLNIQQIPMPCLRSLEQILQLIYMNRRFSWIEFLEEFYSKAQSRKAFFKVLSQWIKRNDIDISL